MFLGYIRYEETVMFFKNIKIPDFLKISSDQKAELLSRLERAAFFTLRFGDKHEYNGTRLFEYFLKYPFEFFNDYYALMRNHFMKNIDETHVFLKEINKQEMYILFNSINTVYPFQLNLQSNKTDQFLATKGRTYVENLLVKLREENKLNPSVNDTLILWQSLKKKIDPQKIIKFVPASPKQLIEKDQGNLFAMANIINKLEETKSVFPLIKDEQLKSNSVDKKNEKLSKKKISEDVQGFLPI